MRSAPNTFYICPDGSDSRDGRAARLSKRVRGPWKSLKGAQDNIRALRASEKISGRVRVIVAGGIYPHFEPVDFGPEDGDVVWGAASGACPIFEGGETISRWREEEVDGRRAWVSYLPEVASGHWYFRSLFVNGMRRPRARFPKFSADRDGVKHVLRIGEIRRPDKQGLFDGDHRFKPKPGDVKNWPSLPDAEIVLLHYWIETRLGAPRMDPATGWITCEKRSVFNLYESPKLDIFARYYIDNLREALTEPGEWYLERSTGKLTYLPLPHEHLENSRVVAPRTNVFLRVNGSAFNHDTTTGDPFGGKPVRGLHFEGLGFRYGDWFQPQAEFLGHNRLRAEDVPIGSAPQAALHVPAAIEFSHASECSVADCTIELTGFSGVEFGPGCRDCCLSRSTIRDVGASGVKIGGSELDGPQADRTGHITLTDNKITDVGRVFHQGTGILLTNAFCCRIAHNEVARTCYTGISCGWSWGYRETISRDNLIENNLIHDIGQGVLSDMGGIYLLGVQPGTVVRGNHIHAVASADYGGWGIYPDEGSSHLLIEHNWVHDTQGSCLRIHFARDLVVRDNVLARCSLEGLVGLGKAEAHIAANVFHNILLGPAPAPFDGGYSGDVFHGFRSDANLIWFPGGKVPACTNNVRSPDVPARISFARWKQRGNDRCSLVADPRAVETAVNFKLPANSPVWKIGFRPYDWSVCGPRKSRGTGTKSKPER